MSESLSQIIECKAAALQLKIHWDGVTELDVFFLRYKSKPERISFLGHPVFVSSVDL